MAAIFASLALLNLTHQNVLHLTSLFISFFRLDSDAHYFKTFFDYTDLMNNEDLHTVVLFVWVYAAIRFIEGYGLVEKPRMGRVVSSSSQEQFTCLLRLAIW